MPVHCVLAVPFYYPHRDVVSCLTSNMLNKLRLLYFGRVGDESTRAQYFSSRIVGGLTFLFVLHVSFNTNIYL